MFTNVNCHWLARIVNIWYNEPSFYFSWVWAPPFDLKVQLSSFFSTLSGITGVSKAQLVSSCGHVATLLVTQMFLLLSGAIRHVLERSRSLSHWVTESTYFSHAKLPNSPCFKESWRDGEALLHYYLSLPCQPNVRNLHGGVNVLLTPGLIMALSFESENA